MRIRLLALDIDGTLLTSNHEISAGTRAAVRAIAGQGVRIVLASARSPSALRPLMVDLNLDGFAVSFNGGLLCRLSRESSTIEVISEQRLPIAPARTIANRAQKYGISIGWFVGERWYISTWDKILRHEANIIGVEPEAGLALETLTDAPHKLQCMVANLDQVSRLKQLERELPDDCAGKFSHPTYLEITAKGVDKALGLEQLGQQLGLNPSDIAAIGDGENDLTMLQSVGLGIAMGNASSLLKNSAAWITTTNDQDGVAAAIERLQREGLV